MRDLTFFKEKAFPFNISEQMTVVLKNKHQPVITDNDDYSLGEGSQIMRILKAENLILDAEQATILQDFYYEMEGSKYLFLVEDHFYSHSNNAYIGTGTGTQTAFRLMADIGGAVPYNIYIYNDGLEVYCDGLLQSADDYTLIDGQIILFDAPPDDNVEVTASFHYDFIMRFDDNPLKFIPDKGKSNYKININLI